MMTALLIAKRTFLQKIGVKEADLMFDKDNPTIEEEILQEGITEVLVRPKKSKVALTYISVGSESPKFGSSSPKFETKEESKDPVQSD